MPNPSFSAFRRRATFTKSGSTSALQGLGALSSGRHGRGASAANAAGCLRLAPVPEGDDEGAPEPIISEDDVQVDSRLSPPSPRTVSGGGRKVTIPEDSIYLEQGGIFYVGSASPRPSPFVGSLPADIDSKLQIAQRRSVLQSVAEADAVAAAADKDAALVAGVAVATSAVLLDAAVKAGKVDLEAMYCKGYMRAVFARKLARARDRAIIAEEGPCWRQTDAATSEPSTAGDSTHTLRPGLLSLHFKPKPYTPCATSPTAKLHEEDMSNSTRTRGASSPGSFEADHERSNVFQMSARAMAASMSSLTLPSSPMFTQDGDRDAFATCMGAQALADAANHPFPRLRSIATCLGRQQSPPRATEASTPRSARHTDLECVSDRGASARLASAPSVAPATIDMLWMGSPVASAAEAAGDGRGRGGLFGWLRGVSEALREEGRGRKRAASLAMMRC